MGEITLRTLEKTRLDLCAHYALYNIIGAKEKAKDYAERIESVDRCIATEESSLKTK